MKHTSIAGFAALALNVFVWSVYASGPTITARLIDENWNASRKAASVEVTVQGIQLVEPSLTSQSHGPVQGHLHYQLDDGSIVATSASKISFHELSPGEHKISVNLTDGNHIPIGMPIALTLTIPAIKTVTAY